MSKLIDYEALEQRQSNEMDKELKRKLESKDWGRSDSLRYLVLKYVTESNYDAALKELHEFVKDKKDYPNFQERCSRYKEHCDNLINAIRAKRDFPGFASLSLSKRQELHEKVVDHFEELKNYIKSIERMEKEVKLDDVRSTVWIVRAAFHSLFAIFLIAFFQEVATGGLGSSFLVVVNEILNNSTDAIFTLLGY